MEETNGGRKGLGSLVCTSTSNEYSLPSYKVGKTIGLGSFGKVKIAEHALTGQKVAIKILHREKIKDSGMDERVRREIKILRLIMHPHIIRLYEVIESSTHIFLVMEYLKSGELFDYIIEKGRLLEDEARRLFQQIVSGVEHCHRNMVVHRDLKPENLLLDSRCNVKIADFGLSNVMRDGHFLNTSCGSPNYAAPEVISGKLYAGPEVDVWSCGVILYALLCGSLPYDDENIPTLFRKIKGGIYTLPSYLSPGARDLISRMLLVDPLKRITIPEIRQHQWYQEKLQCYRNAPSPEQICQQANRIDEDILEEVVSMGFDKRQLVKSLKNRVANKETVAYYLLLDNRCDTNNVYREVGFHEAQERVVPMPSMSSNSVGIPIRYIHPVSHPTGGQSWALGLQSLTSPREIMTEVLKALQEIGVTWRKIGPYNVKGRWIPSKAAKCPGSPDISGCTNSNSENLSTMPLSEDQTPNLHDNSAAEVNDRELKDLAVVKFEAQLYTMKDETYLLDLQLLHGPNLVFLDFCFVLLKELWFLWM